MQKRNKITLRLSASVAIVVLLCICLAVTTLALVYSMVSVDNNLFVTGTVKINLNDNKPIISENEFIFEPGMTVKKDFFVKNESSCDVYYKLYFKNINGELADVLEVKIYSGDTVIYDGTPTELTRNNVLSTDDILRLNETKKLSVYFHFPENAGNETENLFLSFDFAADAVQVKNNSNKEFG